MPAITIRQYNADSGALLSNISVLNAGRITSGTHSRVMVIDAAFSDVTAVGNIRLGLINSGGLTVNTNPIDILGDGTAGNGHFGIESSADFDSEKASSPLKRHFKGVNTTVTAGDTNNVTIPNRSSTKSDYIYLDIEIGSSNISAGTGAFKIFFDFS